MLSYYTLRSRITAFGLWSLVGRAGSVRRMATTRKAVVKFGPYEVTDQVFLQTKHSFAITNIKPIIPGHVLVCPLTPHRRFTDLSPQELSDLFTSVQLTQRALAAVHFPPPATTTHTHTSTTAAINSKGTEPQQSETTHPNAKDAVLGGSFNIAVQDGAAAGQTVSHVHVHVIPRITGDLERSDDVYENMTSEQGNVGGALWDREREGGSSGRRPEATGAMPRVEDGDRRARTAREMNEEAEMYRKVLGEMEVGAVR